MISVREAKDIIAKSIFSLPPACFSLAQASGLVLAEDVYSLTDIPPFNQSGMDGYAISFDQNQPGKEFLIMGEVPAGSTQNAGHAMGSAVRIFTGAPVPKDADTVVMQERTEVKNSHLIILDPNLNHGSNVRLKATEIKNGELALKKETILSPAAVGFLAGVGISEVNAYPKPRVTIIVTGNELKFPGTPLQSGEVYESNSFSLIAALRQLDISQVNILRIPDDLDLLTITLQDAASSADLILLSGGVSVGKFDFVVKAAQLSGVTLLFHKVKQKPGNPLFLGKKGNCIIFGLPGNPSSALTCFYEYVIPAIGQMTRKMGMLKVTRLPLYKSYSKKNGVTIFLKGLFQEETVIPLDAQESYRLSSFAQANCLICLEEEGTEYNKGDEVEVHFFPF